MCQEAGLWVLSLALPLLENLRHSRQQKPSGQCCSSLEVLWPMQNLLSGWKPSSFQRFGRSKRHRLQVLRRNVQGEQRPRPTFQRKTPRWDCFYMDPLREVRWLFSDRQGIDTAPEKFLSDIEKPKVEAGNWITAAKVEIETDQLRRRQLWDRLRLDAEGHDRGGKCEWSGSLIIIMIYEESIVDKFKSNLLLMIFWLHIIIYNS